MGQAKKEGNRKIRQNKVGDGMNNVKTKGENFYRYVLVLALAHDPPDALKLPAWLVVYV